MTRRIMITRPEPDARGIADALASLGIEVLIEPMMTIEMLGGRSLKLDDAQAVLATSANGARALAARTDRRDLALYAVGDATARTARALGFRSVASAAGEVDTLAALVVSRCRPGDGALVHAAGATLAGDLGAALAAAGFDYRREVLYEARPVPALSEAARAALSTGMIEGVALFSPRTARIFVERTRRARLAPTLASADAFCLSAAVLDAAADVSWRRLVVAEAPTAAALIAAVRAARSDH